MSGSNPFKLIGKNKVIIDTITNNKNTLVIVPNSFAKKSRPTYSNPDTLEHYNNVLCLREKELQYTISKLNDMGINSISLIGNSEGALSVLYAKNETIKKKLIMSFSCEDNYYTTINKKKLKNQLNTYHINRWNGR